MQPAAFRFVSFLESMLTDDSDRIMIHPTSICEGDVQLGEDVHIGPNCVLTGPITLGSGTRLIGTAYLTGPLTMGTGNTVYPFACLGFAPQHTKCDPDTPGPGTVIGNDNTFREGATIHRAFVDDQPTTIGDRNYFMANTHAGHDCQVANDCVLVNNACFGGHVVAGDGVIIGGGSVVHQMCRVGRGAMLSGAIGTSGDIPPWLMLTGINQVGAVNLVGLRRAGFARDQIDTVRWVYRTLYREGRTIKGSLGTLRERQDDPLVAEYIEFIESSDRGIVTARPKRSRSG